MFNFVKDFNIFIFIFFAAGEVVSIAQLASLAGRPVSSSQGSKPVTFQLQGNKLTLSGAPLQGPVTQPRSIQGECTLLNLYSCMNSCGWVFFPTHLSASTGLVYGLTLCPVVVCPLGNVMHLVSSGGQHHLISQPAQVAVLHTLSQSGSISTNPIPASTIPTCSGLAVPLTAAQGIGAVLGVLEFITLILTLIAAVL